jgi:Lysine-specific metallo-endopeptidase
MTKRNFLEKVYNKSQAVLTTQSFGDSLHRFLTTSTQIGEVFGIDGPTAAGQNGLIKFRRMVFDQLKSSKIPLEEFIIAEAKKGEPYSKWNSRAAFLKVLMHFSRHSKRGGQDVWIYSPPKDYGKWIYEEVNGTDSRVLRKLQKTDEIFTEFEKDVMVEALQFALTCAQKAEYLLATGNEATLKIIRRWFADESTSDGDIHRIKQTLLDGFKKVSNTCNASNLIFADDPDDRKSLTKYEALFANVWAGGEGKIRVMYIGGGFKRAGNSGLVWLCAETIIHEATHLELCTKDYRVDIKGLKPISFHTSILA